MRGLYVVRIPNGPCKIGRAGDLASRLAKMQTHHPYDLEVVAWFPDRGHEELAWHHCFDDLRLRGEWFQWAPPIERAVKLALDGQDWTEVAEAPPELVAEYREIDRCEPDPERTKELYRVYLRRWIDSRLNGGEKVRFPPRANTPRTPKSPGPNGFRGCPEILAEIELV